MGAVVGLDQLRSDAHPAGSFSDAAFEHVAHPQLASDLLYVLRTSLVDEAGVARDDEQPADAGEPGDDVLDDAVAEIFLLPVGAHVVEWENRDRRLVGQCERRAAAGRVIEAHPIRPYRPGDILELL